MYTVFFSFKGGVGRTSSVMNTARQLALLQKRVLVIDLDLPAPGVDIFDIHDGPGSPSYNPSKLYFSKTDPDWKSRQIDGYLPRDRVPTGITESAPRGFVEFATEYVASQAKVPDPLPLPPSPTPVILADWGKPRYLSSRRNATRMKLIS